MRRVSMSTARHPMRYLIALWVFLSGFVMLNGLVRPRGHAPAPPPPPSGFAALVLLCGLAFLITTAVGFVLYRTWPTRCAVAVLAAWPLMVGSNFFFSTHRSQWVINAFILITAASAVSIWYVWRPQYRSRWRAPRPAPPVGPSPVSTPSGVNANQ